MASTVEGKRASRSLQGQVMIRPGLVSVTFRQLSPPEIIRLSAVASLEGIEWGGDVHVPAGDVAAAEDAAGRTRDAGLDVAAYGSYYRVGGGAGLSFEQVLSSAVALQTKIVRVWAGGVASAAADADCRRRVAADGRRIAAMAAGAGLTIACEWHGGTLTDTADSARSLFDAVAHPAFKTYWQPRTCTPFEQCQADMDAALPRLAGVHVFQWDLKTADKLPLAEGDAVWPRYLARAATAGDMFALLEFVRGDDPKQLVEDAAVLHRWLRALNP